MKELLLLGVSRRPRQPASLFQDQDRSGDVIRRALYFICGQSQKLGSHVRVFKWQVRATRSFIIIIRRTGHDSTHEAGHGGFDASEHDCGAPCVRASPSARCSPQLDPQPCDTLKNESCSLHSSSIVCLNQRGNSPTIKAHVISWICFLSGLYDDSLRGSLRRNWWSIQLSLASGLAAYKSMLP